MCVVLGITETVIVDGLLAAREGAAVAMGFGGNDDAWPLITQPAIAIESCVPVWLDMILDVGFRSCSMSETKGNHNPGAVDL